MFRSKNEVRSLRIGTKWFEVIMDALPSMLFLVDKGYRIVLANRVAREILGPYKGFTLPRLCGEILRCTHALKESKGCGRSDFCSQCPVRSSIAIVFREQRSITGTAQMALERAATVENFFFLISAAPVIHHRRFFAVLILHDITETVQLKKIVPICAACKKIRNDRNYWEAVEEYLHKHTQMEFSHGICPNCATILYPPEKSKK